ncbi:MAG: hypothetical protein AB8I56_12695, partial [Anaerolineales bacterium]
EFKAVKQLEQILELLTGIGIVKKSGDLYRAVDQQLLETRRQSASSWAKKECKGLVKAFEDLFPVQEWRELSMGMSGDFEVAIQEGATMVRIGTAILGERETKEGK